MDLRPAVCRLPRAKGSSAAGDLEPHRPFEVQVPFLDCESKVKPFPVGRGREPDLLHRRERSLVGDDVLCRPVGHLARLHLPKLAGLGSELHKLGVGGVEEEHARGGVDSDDPHVSGAIAELVGGELQVGTERADGDNLAGRLGISEASPGSRLTQERIELAEEVRSVLQRVAARHADRHEVGQRCSTSRVTLI